MRSTLVRAGVRVTNAVGSVLGRAGIRSVSLAEESLLGAARRATRLEDFGDDRLEPRDIGREVTQRWTAGLERSTSLRHSGQISDDRCVDVHYHALMQDPIAVVRLIYSQLGMPLSATAATRMDRYLADNPKGKNGSHRYALESFGLDAHSLGRRFKSYCEYFGVPAESPARP